MCAAGKGHADCVRVLLDAGADKEAKGHVRLCHMSILNVFSILLVIHNLDLVFCFQVFFIKSLSFVRTLLSSESLKRVL